MADERTDPPLPPEPTPAPPPDGSDLAARYRKPLFAPTLLKIFAMLLLSSVAGLALARLAGVVRRQVSLSHVSSIAKPFLPDVRDRLTLLLLGTDKKIEINRTDTMIVVFLDTKRFTVDTLAILRDTWVETGHANKKINGVFAYESVRTKDERKALHATCEAVTKLIGLPIDYYIRVDLDAFIRVIDLIGGIDIYVDKDMKYDDFKQDLHIDLKKGPQHLDGERAQQFVRFRRDLDGDRTRARRQQRFLRAVVQQVTSPAVLLNLPDVVRGALAEIDTDLPLETALALANHYLATDRINLRTNLLPGDYEKRDELDYFIHDPKKMKQLIAEILDPDRFRPLHVTGEVLLEAADTAEVAAPAR